MSEPNGLQIDGRPEVAIKEAMPLERSREWGHLLFPYQVSHILRRNIIQYSEIEEYLIRYRNEDC